MVIFPIAINTADIAFTPGINLIPFYFGNCFALAIPCVRGIVENIVLTIPFGFGINFLVKIKPKNFTWLGLAIGFLFEISQLTISLAFRSGFRSADINDVIFNGAGVLIGYTFFMLYAWLYPGIIERMVHVHRRKQKTCPPIL